MKIFIIILFILFAVGAGYGQQDPLYALYINNPAVINPGYSGINKFLTANFSYRNQWTAFEGSPTTIAASGNVSIRDNKMGVGLILINDRIGEISNSSANASYAYKLELENHVISFGMQAGLINYKTDPGKLNIRTLDDPSFAPSSETKFNLGSGVVLKNEKYMVGLSVPRMIGNSLKTSGGTVKIYQQHFYLLGSYIYFLNHRILLKPSVLLKGVKGAPLSADLNLALNIDRNYTAGIFTRNFQAFGLQAQFNFMEKYTLGYVYEMPTNNSVGSRYSTHELMIGFRTTIFDYHSRAITNF
jgi:Bacteroidetes-specific putative membrane protein